MPAPQTSLRALVVADSSDELICELSRYGFQVQPRVIATPAEFLQAVAETQWDVILSDQSMKGLASADALKLLRERDSDLPFMVVSDRVCEDALIELLRAGAQDRVIMTSLRQLGPSVERELRETANRRMQRSTQAALQEWNIACGTRNARKPEV